MSDNTHSQDIQDWATGEAGDGSPALSASQIQANLDSEVQTYGNFYTDMASLPSTAEARSNGIFFDINDLAAYLDGGALLYRSSDGTFVPNPIVHIVRVYDEVFDDYLYHVYIDSES